MNEENKIKLICFIIAVVVFLISWLYCIAAYGFFMGVVFGWIPALIAASAAFFLWPIVLGLLVSAAGIGLVLLMLAAVVGFIIYVLYQLS